MKVNKIVCLDEEVIDFLKGQNASKLVNDLVLGYMKESTLDGMSKEQLQAELDIIRLEKAHKKKCEEIRKDVK